MKLMLRVAAPLALGLAVGGCSISSLLGGGGKPATTLQTLTPEAPDPGPTARAVSAGQAVTIGTPAISKELRTTRVPVQISPTDIQYVTGLQWVDTPDRLFQALVAETVRRQTNRVVLDTQQTALDPGLLVSGELQRFGYDSSSGQVIVVYDAMLSAGARIESRRFTATAPADGSGASVGPALNRAANQVAQEVAQWVGGVS